MQNKNERGMDIKEKKYEADNRTATNPEGRAANVPAKRLTVKSIIGERVKNPSGEDLGTIDDLMINFQDGLVEYAIIEFGAFLGIGGKLFAIPLQELKPDREQKIFTLNRDKEYLKRSPGFDKDHWPDTHDQHQYLEEVNTYYKLSSRAFY